MILHFKRSELECSCCGKLPTETGAMTEEDYRVFLNELELLRTSYGKPMLLTSAYRCQAHNDEIGGATNSRHLVGDAIDVAVSGADAYQLIQLASAYGWNGIGVAQKGGGRFIHLDRRQQQTIWSY